MTFCHADSNVIFGLIVTVSVAAIIHCAGAVDVNAPKDLFHLGDKDNSSSLNMDECMKMWLSLDVDGDEAIGKIEFLFKWKFANFPDSDHAPLFLRLVDNDFSGFVTKDEVGKLCSFFDDDDDFLISEQEFDLNWTGMFRTS